MKTGIELIAKERQEQVSKHGWSLDHDKQYTEGQLVQAAKFCLAAHGRGIGFSGDTKEACWPNGWDEKFRRKILCKTQVGMLVTAGAFYWAENDRLGKLRHTRKIHRIAAEIDHLLSTKDSHFKD